MIILLIILQSLLIFADKDDLPYLREAVHQFCCCKDVDFLLENGEIFTMFHGDTIRYSYKGDTLSTLYPDNVYHNLALMIQNQDDEKVRIIKIDR